MIHCRITFPNPLTHLLEIEMKFSALNQASIDLILPAWRPGRYELAPFVENIQKFSAHNSSGAALDWEKSRPNAWSVATQGESELVIRYQYYANRMDAGNSVVNDEQVYLNFINCVYYVADQTSAPIRLSVDLPASYKRACSLKETAPGQYLAESYYELVDAPLLASEHLALSEYQIEGHLFTIARLGSSPLPDPQVLSAFKKFTACQMTAMGGFPASHYIFMIQSLDYVHYHGVEHQNSTVLVLGPNDDAHRRAYYEKLMGVASHELFHAWNVTRIRPREMSPYQFDRETMTDTGFVTEGFTTYYGDLFLKQSGVYDQSEYFKEVNTLLKRHFENYGRLESSLIQSSQNLWVDGYKNLFPSKKVSIYVKGALCALILDLTIRKNTNHQHALIDVLKALYQKHTFEKGGYTRQEAYDMISAIGGAAIPSLLVQLYESTVSLELLLEEALNYVGCELIPVSHPNELTRQLGLQVEQHRIVAIAPGSHVEKFLSVGDEIKSINDSLFEEGGILLKAANTFAVKRGERQMDLDISLTDTKYYESYEIQLIPGASEEQMENLSHWLGNNQK